MVAQHVEPASGWKSPMISTGGATEDQKLMAFSLALCGLFVVTSYPTLQLSTPVYDPSLVGEELAGEVDALRFAPIGVILLLAADLLVLDRLWRVFRTTYQSTYLFGLVLIIMLASALSFRGHAAVSAVMLAFLLANFSVVWGMGLEARQRLYRMLSWLLALYLIAAPAIYGLPQNRWIGGIHPNNYAAAAIPCGIFGLMGFRRWGVLVLFTSIGFAAMVSARYAIVSIIVFCALYCAMRLSRMSRLQWLGLAALLLTLILTLAEVQGYVSELLLLDDPLRGLSSGISGRAENYAHFLPQLIEHPLIGFGFRMREEYWGAHNGYLNVFLENGIFIGFLIILFVGYKNASLVGAALRGGASPESAGIAAGLVAISMGALFQPQLINFGDPMGLTFLMFVTAPPKTPTQPADSNLRRSPSRWQL
jgi:hypothetical protein